MEKIAIMPRKILGLAVPSVSENTEANFTIFDSEVNWELKEENILSKSMNTPFINRKLKGKPVAIFNHNQLQKL
jgi:dihydroorotase